MAEASSPSRVAGTVSEPEPSSDAIEVAAGARTAEEEDQATAVTADGLIAEDVTAIEEVVGATAEVTVMGAAVVEAAMNVGEAVAVPSVP